MSEAIHSGESIPNEQQIRESLEQVLVPGAMRSLMKLNLVRQVSISDQKVNISLASAALNPGSQAWISAQVRDVTKKLPGVKEVEVDFVEASPKDLNEIRHVIAVMSGKGGVGKSLVSGLIGLSLARRGHEVGILDADITGPSIPRMFGITARPMGSDTAILPVVSRAGIEIMSINLLLPHEDDAVIWRGPMIANTIKQFWEDVLWGRLDYLLIDLPPGTADAPLTVMQSLPLSGVVIVFSPQELAVMVVRKAVQMTQKMNIPVLGVVENMSYFLLPDTGKRIELFGSSKGQEMAKAAGAPLLGQLPIDPELARLCDEGNIERYDSDTLSGFAEAFLQAMSAKAK
ncbi:MAG: Mrp/NBP35 family ATP-binding protein [Chloroflexota bacterium]